MKRIFLSYGHDHTALFAAKIKSDLENADYETWFDAERLCPGGDWERYIEEGLEWVSERPEMGYFILLMTPHSVRRPDGYCLNELARAMARQLKIIPVLVETVEPPLSIARIQWLDMRDARHVDEDVYQVKFRRLLHAIKTDDLDFAGTTQRLIQRLDPLSFQTDITRHLDGFTGRTWVLDEIKAWLQGDERAFWLTGGPGTGKTALSAWLTTQLPKLAAVHFCQHGHARKNDAHRAVTSLAYQLSMRLPDYQARLNALPLEEILSEQSAETLFEELFIQPLAGITLPDGENLLILIDALDEASHNGANPLVNIVGSGIERTPDWLRFLVTSRPNEPEVSLPLQHLSPFRLEAQKPNGTDLAAFLRSSLERILATPPAPATIDKIESRCEGSFLYALWVCREIATKRLDLEATDALPSGFAAMLLQTFKRQFPDIGIYKSAQRLLFEVLTTAREPMAQLELAQILNWTDYDGDEIIESCGSILFTEGDRLAVFHLSVLEWLLDRKKSGPYAVAETAGHRRLADYGWGLFQRDPAAMTSYAMTATTHHLMQVNRIEEACALLFDFSLMQRRVAADFLGFIEDLRMMQGQNDLAADDAKATEDIISIFDMAYGLLLAEPDHLTSQLQARLVNHANTRLTQLVAQASASAKSTILRALTPALRQAGDPLRRVLPGTAESLDSDEVFAMSAVAVDEVRGLAMAGGEMGVLHVWQTSTGTPQYKEALEDASFSCSTYCQQSGRWFLGDWEGRITVFDVDAMTLRSIRDASGKQVVNMAISRCGTKLAAIIEAKTGETSALQIWNISDKDPKTVSLTQNAGSQAISFLPDQPKLVLANDKTVEIIDPDTGETEPTGITITQPVREICFSADGDTLALGINTMQIQLISWPEGRLIGLLNGGPDGKEGSHLSGLVFTNADANLLSSGWDGALRLWDTQSFREIGSCPNPSQVYGLHLDQQTNRAITGHKVDGARIWDIKNLVGTDAVERHANGAQFVVPLTAHGLVATGGARTSGDGIRIWNLADGRCLKTIEISGEVSGLSATSDGSALVVLEGHSIRHLKVDFEAPDGVVSVHNHAPESAVGECPSRLDVIRLAETKLVSLRSGWPATKLVTWQAPKWQAETIAEFKTAYDPCLALTTDGQHCALVLDDVPALILYDLGSGGQRSDVPFLWAADVTASAVAMSAAGGQIAVGTKKGHVHITDSNTRQTTELRPADNDYVSALCFTEDEARLIVGTYGGRVEVWDVPSSKRLSAFCNNDGWLAVWASSEQRRIVACDLVGAVHFLEIPAFV